MCDPFHLPNHQCPPVTNSSSRNRSCCGSDVNYSPSSFVSTHPRSNRYHSSFGTTTSSPVDVNWCMPNPSMRTEFNRMLHAAPKRRRITINTVGHTLDGMTTVNNHPADYHLTPDCVTSRVCNFPTRRPDRNDIRRLPTRRFPTTESDSSYFSNNMLPLNHCSDGWSNRLTSLPMSLPGPLNGVPNFSSSTMISCDTAAPHSLGYNHTGRSLSRRRYRLPPDYIRPRPPWSRDSVNENDSTSALRAVKRPPNLTARNLNMEQNQTFLIPTTVDRGTYIDEWCAVGTEDRFSLSSSSDSSNFLSSMITPSSIKSDDALLNDSVRAPGLNRRVDQHLHPTMTSVYGRIGLNTHLHTNSMTNPASNTADRNGYQRNPRGNEVDVRENEPSTVGSFSATVTPNLTLGFGYLDNPIDPVNHNGHRQNFCTNPINVNENGASDDTGHINPVLDLTATTAASGVAHMDSNGNPAAHLPLIIVHPPSLDEQSENLESSTLGNTLLSQHHLAPPMIPSSLRSTFHRSNTCERPLSELDGGSARSISHNPFDSDVSQFTEFTGGVVLNEWESIPTTGETIPYREVDLSRETWHDAPSPLTSSAPCDYCSFTNNIPVVSSVCSGDLTYLSPLCNSISMPMIPIPSNLTSRSTSTRLPPLGSQLRAPFNPMRTDLVVAAANGHVPVVAIANNLDTNNNGVQIPVVQSPSHHLPGHVFSWPPLSSLLTGRSSVHPIVPVATLPAPQHLAPVSLFPIQSVPLGIEQTRVPRLFQFLRQDPFPVPYYPSAMTATAGGSHASVVVSASAGVGSRVAASVTPPLIPHSANGFQPTIESAASPISVQEQPQLSVLHSTAAVAALAITSPVNLRRRLSFSQPQPIPSTVRSMLAMPRAVTTPVTVPLLHAHLYYPRSVATVPRICYQPHYGNIGQLPRHSVNHPHPINLVPMSYALAPPNPGVQVTSDSRYPLESSYATGYLPVMLAVPPRPTTNGIPSVAPSVGDRTRSVNNMLLTQSLNDDTNGTGDTIPTSQTLNLSNIWPTAINESVFDNILNAFAAEQLYRIEPPLEANFNRPLGLSKEELAGLPMRIFTSNKCETTAEADTVNAEETEASSERCMICLDDYREADRLRTLHCHHEFHVPCVDKWLKTKRTCPLCRADACDGSQQKEGSL